MNIVEDNYMTVEELAFKLRCSKKEGLSGSQATRFSKDSNRKKNSYT